MKSFRLMSWTFAAALLWAAIPYVVVFTVGFVWTWQHGWIWHWVVGTGLTMLTGWWAATWALRKVRGEIAAAPPPAVCGTPLAEQAREAVREIAQRVQKEDLSWDRPGAIWEVILEVLEAVAKQYFPKSQQPLLERPLPLVLGAVELALRDLRLASAGSVPWSNTITIKGWLWLKDLGEWTWPAMVKGYNAYRLLRLFNPSVAIAREGLDWLTKRLGDYTTDQVRAWAIQFCLTRIGDYAIELYSGQLVFADEYRARVSLPAPAVSFDQEPLQVLVVGQVKAGKSSLINALLGEMQAAVDALPETRGVTLYECQREDLPAIVLRDTAGYSAAGDAADAFSQLGALIQQCDLLLLVTSARSAARQPDRELLAKIHEFYQRELAQKTPPILCVLTHWDQVREQDAQEVLAVVSSDLALPAARLAPVCAAWGRLQGVEGLVRLIGEELPEANRLKIVRCIRQIRKERDETTLLENLFKGASLGWQAMRRA